MAEEKLAATFVALADTLVDDFDLNEFLQMLVERCVDLLDVSAAGLMLGDSHGRLQMMASSSEEAHLLELHQLRNEQGPCLDCFRTGKSVEHAELREAGDRWPQFAPAAVDAGFRSVRALPMRVRGRVLGALNLFRVDPGGTSAQATSIGQALVDVATIGLIQQRAGRESQLVVEQLQAALDSRVLIEQAKGFLARHHDITPAGAFALLRNQARSSNRRLADLAHAVIDRDPSAAALIQGIGREPLT